MSSLIDSLCKSSNNENDFDVMKSLFSSTSIQGKRIGSDYLVADSQIEEFKNFIKAVRNDDLNKVKEIYDSNFKILNIVDSDGLNACMHSSGNVLNFLIKCRGVDIFQYDSMGKSFFDILRQRGEKIDDMKLLRSPRISNRIINIPLLQPNTLSKKLRDIFLYDDIQTFKDNESEYGIDVFLLACHFKAWIIVDYLLTIYERDKFFDPIEYVCPSRFTPLSYIFYYEREDIAERIFKLNCKHYKRRNIFNELEISYGENCIEFKISIIQDSINKKVKESNKLQTFKKDDFKTVIFNSKLESGISGSISYVMHRKTNIEVVLKKIELKNDENENTNLNPIHFQEINIHKFVNDNNPDLACTLLGYYIYDGSLYLVLEPMFCTLHTYLNILKKDMKIFHKNIKNILHQVCEILDGLASIGIVHRDMKTNNIMVDRFGDLRLIDFGFSQFIGLGMSKALSDNLLPIKYIYPPDRIGNINLKMINGTTRNFKTDRKTLNIDTYGIGVNLLTMIVSDEVVAMMSTMFTNSGTGRPQSFIADFEGIYATNNRENSYDSENLWYNFNLLWLKDFEDHYALYDMFKWMVNSNSNHRSFGKDCLKHPYFTCKGQSWPNAINISPEMRYSLVTYIFDNQFEAHYKNNMIEIFKKLRNYETIYSNSSVINSEIEEKREEREEDYFDSIHYVFNLFKKTKSTSLDVLFNFIGKFRVFVVNDINSKNPIPTDKRKEVYLAHAIMLYIITDIQFEDTMTLKGSDIIERSVIFSNYQFDSRQMKQIFDILRKESYIFTMIPIQTMLTNIIIDLKRLNHPTREIENRISVLLLKTQAYIKIDCNAWDLIWNLFHHIMPFVTFNSMGTENIELQNNISEIVTNYDWMNEDEMRQLLI